MGIGTPRARPRRTRVPVSCSSSTRRRSPKSRAIDGVAPSGSAMKRLKESSATSAGRVTPSARPTAITSSISVL